MFNHVPYNFGIYMSSSDNKESSYECLEFTSSVVTV